MLFRMLYDDREPRRKQKPRPDKLTSGRGLIVTILLCHKDAKHAKFNYLVL